MFRPVLLKHRTAPGAPGAFNAPRGFTLIEVLVALSILALLALMSWRGLDAMLRVQQTTSRRASDLQGLQAGLNQWTRDLDMLVQTPYVNAVDWNGQTLRIVRRDMPASSTATEVLRVVAWSQLAPTRLNDTAQAPRWARWQSGELRSSADLAQAWQLAATWPQSAPRAGSDNPAQQAVAVAAVNSWQVFYHRAGGWTPAPVGSPALTDVPDGVRLVLELPPGGVLAGRLTADWTSPTASGGRS